jgi:hypothetical protein
MLRLAGSLPLWIKSTNGGKRDLKKIIWRWCTKNKEKGESARGIRREKKRHRSVRGWV